MRKNYPSILSLLLLLLLTACNLPASPGDDPGGGMNAIQTAAAQTVIAQSTLAAQNRPTVTSGPLQFTPEAGTITPTLTATSSTPLSTEQANATASSAPAICDRAEFVVDVQVKDGDDFTPGQTFTKIWRLRNNGTCTWSTSYVLVFKEGTAMGAPATQALPNSVAPGQTVDISIQLKAPDNPGEYRADFLLRNAEGQTFGLGSNADKTFWVKIDVVLPSGIALDMISDADLATWTAERNGSTVNLPYRGAQDNPDGLVMIGDELHQENKKLSSRVLYLIPPQYDNSVLRGVFPAYTVQTGDRLRGGFGFVTGEDYVCGSQRVIFRILIRDGSNTSLLREWTKTCDGSPVNINLDLAAYKGKSINVIIELSTDGSYVGDRIFGSSLRIER